MSNNKNYKTLKGLKIGKQSQIRTLEKRVDLISNRDDFTIEDEMKCNKIKESLKQFREDIKNIQPPKPIYKYSCAYCINGKMTKKEIKGINKIFRISNEPCQSCITNERLSHFI